MCVCVGGGEWGPGSKHGRQTTKLSNIILHLAKGLGDLFYEKLRKKKRKGEKKGGGGGGGGRSSTYVVLQNIILIHFFVENLISNT